jgi:hypothetical protein
MAKHLAVVRLREAGLRQTTAPLPRAGPHPKVTKREEEAIQLLDTLLEHGIRPFTPEVPYAETISSLVKEWVDENGEPQVFHKTDTVGFKSPLIKKGNK